jgi:hypothetical protein
VAAQPLLQHVVFNVLLKAAWLSPLAQVGVNGYGAVTLSAQLPTPLLVRAFDVAVFHDNAL